MKTNNSYFSRILVILIAVMMVFTMMPSMAFADEEEPENTASLPTWYRPADGRIVLAEVMFSFLEGKSPELPSGVKLVLPREEHSYGTESILEDGKKIFRLAEKRGGSLIFCLTGEKEAEGLF